MIKFYALIIRLSMLVTIVAASRPFNLILSEVECTADYPEYVTIFTCRLNNVGSKSYAEGYLILAKEIKKFDVKARADFVRSAGSPPLVLFDFLLDGCNLLQKSESNNIVKVLFDFMRKLGHFPERCPLSANENFTVTQFMVDPHILPMYTPDFSFSLNLTLLLKSKAFATLVARGRTETKRRNIFKNK